jgi:hypothetical protein
MQTPRPSIFRKNAVKHYMQGRDKDTLPHFISLPTTLILWILIMLVVVAAGLAWSEKIPVFVTGKGIVLHERAYPQAGGSADQGTFALIFLPPEQATRVHVGLPVRLRIGPSGPEVVSKIAGVEADVMSPYDACREYGLDANCAVLITRPAVVALVKLQTVPSTIYAGSVLTAEVEVGSQRIISLLPV